MKTRLIIFALILCAFSFQNSLADHRGFVWTYEYMIMERGEVEFEQYSTFSTADKEDFENTTNAELKFEFEIGMTDIFDFAIYQVFKQNAVGGFAYGGFQLRSRFKIGEKDQFFMDPLIYIEYGSNPGFSEHKIEPKLILAKDFGDFNLALNPYCEFEYEDEWEFKPKYAAGLSYKLGKLFSAGIEFKGSETGQYVGPTISHGHGKVWVALGTLFGYGGIKAGKPQHDTRMIIGIHL
jgi:hypothetical protein